MTIEFLGFPGCPHAPALRESLRAALKSGGGTLTFKDVNQQSLPPSDIRRGWPSPTVLVDGQDLFGMAPSAEPAMGCRVYAGGLPTPAMIAQRLHAKTEFEREVTR